MKQSDLCAVESCGKSIQARGLCPMHYQRQRIHGSVEYVKPTESPTEAAARFWAKVKKAHGCWLWQAGINKAGYGTFSYRGSCRRAHRLSYELSVGAIPAGKVVDHVCHTLACVNPSHLRLATVKQNAENRKGSNRNGKSGVRGVWRRDDGRWVGSVTHNYVKHTAQFETREAATAYVTAKRHELYTHTIERMPT